MGSLGKATYMYVHIKKNTLFDKNLIAIPALESNEHHYATFTTSNWK